MDTVHAVLIGYQNEVMLGYVTGYYIYIYIYIMLQAIIYIYIYIYIYIIKNINDNIYLLLAEFSVCDLWPKCKACGP